MRREKCTFSLLSLGIFLLEAGLTVACVRSVAVSAGEEDLWVGCVELLCVLLSIVGIHMAWLDRDLLGSTYHFPVFMMGLHIFFILVMAVIYIIGLTGGIIFLNF